MGAGDEGVEAFDLVREAVGDEEFERPVGNGGLRAEPGIAQSVKHLVGAKRAVLLQEDFKRLASDRREAQAFALAMRFGRCDTRADAERVIVFVKSDRIARDGFSGFGSTCHVISFLIPKGNVI